MVAIIFSPTLFSKVGFIEDQSSLDMQKNVFYSSKSLQIKIFLKYLIYLVSMYTRQGKY